MSTAAAGQVRLRRTVSALEVLAVRECSVLVDSWGCWFSGRVCGGVDGLKLDRREVSEAGLSPSSVVGFLDPVRDGQSELVLSCPLSMVKHVFL